jgi:hypothetical protein
MKFIFEHLIANKLMVKIDRQTEGLKEKTFKKLKILDLHALKMRRR